MTAQPAESSARAAEAQHLGPSIAARIFSGLAGIAVLGVTAVPTLGTSLAAPLGILVARRLARRRERQLTRGGSWLAAMIASSAAIVCAFGIAASRAPAGSLERIKEAAAARQSAPTPQLPAWFTRAFPQAAQQPDPVTERIVNSRAFALYFGLLGAGTAIAIFGAIVGSMGWVGTLLLTHAFSRRLRA